MYDKKLICPYCKKEQNPHGFGQLERLNERHCQICGKPFVFTVSVHYQTFVEADSSEPQAEETPAVDTLKQMIADATPRTERKAYVDRAIFDRFTQYCITNSKSKSEIYRTIARKHGISSQSVTAMLNCTQNTRESIMETICGILDIRFELKETNHRNTWTIKEDKPKQQKSEPVKTETQAPPQLNTDGMTTFEYIFGYNTITETRKINPADIPAYLEKLSAKKEHRDVITGKPKPWELLKINGVPVEKEDAA